MVGKQLMNSNRNFYLGADVTNSNLTYPSRSTKALGRWKLKTHWFVRSWTSGKI